MFMSHYNVDWDNNCDHCLQASSENLYRLSIKSHKSSLLLVHAAKSQLEMTKFWRLWACCDYQHILYKIYLWTEEPERPREGWPLLTVETYVGTQRVHTKGVLPWFVRRARRAGTRDLYPALAALVSPVKKILFSSPYTVSIYVSPSPWAQSCRDACLWIFCLREELWLDAGRLFWPPPPPHSVRGLKIELQTV